MEKNSLAKIASIITVIGLTSCSSGSVSTGEVNPSYTTMAQRPTTPLSMYDTASWQGSNSEIWNKLQRVSSSKLADMQSKTNDPIKKSWIQLAILTKQKGVTTQQLASELIAWREHNPSHPANQLLPDNGTLNRLLSSPPPRQIAILLPQNGTYGASGQNVREGFLNAYYANMAKFGKQNIKFYDTSQSQDMAVLYQQAVSDGADFVIGPLAKEHVQQLKGVRSFSTPTLALNYADNNSSSQSKFYEFGLLPEDEALQIAENAHEAGHLRALVIAPQNAWGKRLVSAFSTHWQAVGGSIQDSWYYSPQSNFSQDVAHLLKVNPDNDKKLMQQDNNKTVLEQQRRHDFDVIFLFSQPQDARAIVPLLHYYYAGDVPVYATSAVYSGKPNPVKDVDLNGVIVCDIPWRMRGVKNSSNNGVSSDRLFAVGEDAYLLSQSLQRLEQLPNFPIYGTTGALTMTSQHQIHRRLPCVPFRNGLI